MAKKVEKVKHFPKDNLFGQKIEGYDRKKKKAIFEEVNYHEIKFKRGTIKFVKDEEVTKDQLSLMNDYQKKFYLK